jgi:hypothetical protein
VSYMHFPAQIAAALRALAEDFDDAPDVRLPDLRVSVDVQVCVNGADEWRRIAAVDLLTYAALGIDGEPDRMTAGDWYHLTPRTDRTRTDGLEVSVFTAQVSAPVDESLAALDAELAVAA